MSSPTSNETPAPADNQAAPSSGQPASQPAPAQPQHGGDAPVTRSEFEALLAKLDGLASAKPEPPPKPDADESKSTKMPQWAKEMGLDKLAGTIQTLAQTQAQATIAGKRQALQSAVLADVPESNRALAQLALEGLITSSGIDLSTADVNQIAPQLSAALREKVGASLFVSPGSQFSAIPAKGNGEYDWSHVNTLEEVPPGMRTKMPREVWDRITGGGGGQVSTQGTTTWRPGNTQPTARA